MTASGTSAESGQVENTDRHLWPQVSEDAYAPRLFVTAGDGIGIDVGGHVIVKPLRAWHALATAQSPAPMREALADETTEQWSARWQAAKDRAQASKLAQCSADDERRARWCAAAGISYDDPTAGGTPAAFDDEDHMVKITKMIADLQAIKDRFGDTCVYVRRGGLSWGAVALNRRDDDKKHGVFDLHAQHDRDMLERLEQIDRLKKSRDEAQQEAIQARGLVENYRAFTQFAIDGFDNQDINHVDYRVGIYKAALDAIEDSSTDRDHA
jgi:hypothetical protein